MPALAVPARFAPNPHRRALLAKVHLGKKELGLHDDDYRAILARVAGRTSAADCTEPELVRVVEEMKAKGFAGKPKPRPAGAVRPGSGQAATKPADHPAARKARALWISLHQLGAIDNPSEQALEAFARRQLGVERLQWADQARVYKLVEALKAIGTRDGWEPDLRGLGPSAVVKVLKLSLCRAILAKLQEKGLAAPDWTLGEAAFRLLGMGEGWPGEDCPQQPSAMPGAWRPDHFGGPDFWSIGDIEVLAQGLGRKLRGEA